MSDLRDLPGKGVDTTKKLLDRSIDEMKSTVGDVLDKVKPDKIPLPRSLDFPSLGQILKGSPLSGFLGGLVNPSKPCEPKGVNTSGSQIPGGPSLYTDGLGMFHQGAPGAPDTYAFQNTPEGIEFAAEHGYKCADLDMQITKDGVLVASHWDQPMKKDGFQDPLGKLDQDTRIKDMTLAEVMRLRNEDGQSRIYTVSSLIEQLKSHGLAGDLEAKKDPRFATDKVMGQVADMVRGAGIEANLKSIDYGSGANDVLEMAQKHGFWVRSARGSGREARQFGYGAQPETAGD